MPQNSSHVYIHLLRDVWDSWAAAILKTRPQCMDQAMKTLFLLTERENKKRFYFIVAMVRNHTAVSTKVSRKGSKSLALLD